MDDNFDKHNLGDLKLEIKYLIELIDSREIYEMLEDFENLDKLKTMLLKLQTRIDYCGHCNGATYENGVCTEHFTD